MRFARLPIRIRLTAAFAVVIALVFTTAGVIVYSFFEEEFDNDIDAPLVTRAVDITALVSAGGGPSAVASSGERYAQVYGSDGRILASTAGAAHLRMLSPARTRDALRNPVWIHRAPLDHDSVRVRAIPAQTPGGRVAIAVGDSLARHDRALNHLKTVLLIAGPLALLLASFAGYEVAGAALRPVERMRAEAEQINERQVSERLPVSAAHDEVGALGRTLNALLDRIESAMAHERRLVSDASHELRTPLTTLRAEVDLALRGDRDAPELRAALESAAEEAARMTRLADDLLVLARADQGRLPLQPEPLDAAGLLETVARRAAAQAEAGGRTISVDAHGAGEPVLLADRDRTIQAIDNLVTNALLYGEGTVVLSAHARDSLVELHVGDDGPGFPTSMIDAAFERFLRGDDARASGSGSGLGLAIVDAIARAHGGEAGARNRPEGGADVWIALPRASA
jgi:signal transduction histidine kinase